MNKTKTGRLHLLKFALVLPIITVLLLAFRNKYEIYSTASPQQNTVTKTYILSFVQVRAGQLRATSFIICQHRKILA